ncbi:ABC transporter substrate-binding protein [Paenibacillus sepulcri]|uniref:Sugar ABC transporter substrate-binding protein n=1 Tax=Paenibacillus sepulcri TaxID=359917 RepID=A0ABS7C853_9BACL|nr:sugar ABC transporter substrate-binding protein [Paenibacillus sepulcri]
MVRKTNIHLLIVCLLVLGLLAGCMKDSNGSGSGGKTEIVFWQPDLANWQPLYEKLVKKFEESHPDIRIKMANIPEEGYFEKLNTAFAAGKGPDMWVGWYPGNEFDRGYIQPIDEFIEASGWDMNQYFQPITDLRLKGADGHYYGLPRDYSSSVVLYNKDLFDAAQVPYPTEDWTVDDFRSIAKSLTNEEKKVFGTDIATGDSLLTGTPLVWNYGGDMISEDGLTVKGVLDSPETMKAYELGQQLMKDGSVLPSSISETMTGDNGAFGSGTVGMTMGTLWGYNSLKDVTFKWGAVSFPKVPGGEDYAWADIVSWFMNAKSKHKEATWEFMKFMSSTEIGQDVAEELTWGPPIPKIWEDQKLLDNEALKVFYDQGAKPTKKPVYVRNNAYDDITSDMTQTYTDIVNPLKGVEMKSPGDVLPQAAEEMQKKLDEAQTVK